MFGEVITAVITPFDKKGKVNFKSLEKLLKHLIKNGSDGLLMTGTTGECPTLTHEEEQEIYKCALKVAKGKAKVIAGTGSNDTAAAIMATAEAEAIGVDAAMIVVPYYNKPSQEGMYQHFKAIAESTKLPLIIYNIPGRTGVNMQTSTLLRLAEIENYVSVKEASGNLDQIKEVIKSVPKDFIVYSGDDGLTFDIVKLGGRGVISVASHLVGKDIKKTIELIDLEKEDEAKLINDKLMPLFKTLFITSNPTPVKEALNQMGFDVGRPRLPLIEANSEEKEKITAVLKNLKLI